MFVAIRERLEKDEDGFTLIELLVVVIIIGILAAIAIPTFLNQRERGWQAELTSSVRNYALELEATATAANGRYPAATAIPAQGNFNAGGAVTFTYAPVGTSPNFTGFTLCGTTNKITSTPNRVRYLGGTAGTGVQGYEAVAC